MKQKDAHDVRELLRFDENTAGGMMNTDTVVVGEDATRAEVLDHVRYQEIPVDQLDGVILIDREARFTGVVPVARLLLADPQQPMKELRLEPSASVHADAEEKEVFEIFDRYNLRSLTVVDQDNRPIGAITVDDVVNRLREKL